MAEKKNTRHGRYKHGMAGTRIYWRWDAMLRRCYDPKHKGYAKYGERGIDVCQEWRTSFEAFYADMGEPPFPGATLDRIDNASGYFPGNVRWSTAKQQANNTRRNRVYTLGEDTHTLAEWLAIYGVDRAVVKSRLTMGWSFEEAITHPVRPHKYLTYQGKTMTQAQWERELGLARGTIKRRLREGWNLEDAFTRPIERKGVRCTHCQQSLPCSCPPSSVSLKPPIT